MATYTKETALYDTAAIAGDIEEAGTKATNYLAADSSGIMVYDGSQGAQTPSSATTKNVFIDADSMDVRNGTDVLATFGADNSRIGGENSTRLLLKPTMMSLVSEENSNFFSVDSDNGQTTGPIKVSDAVSASIISPVTIYINEAPSTAPIKIDCACECHIYFSENKYHSYVTSMASPSDNAHVSFPKISRSGYKDWSAEWKAHLFDIHYGTAISKNASRAYTTLRVDDVNDALTFNVSIEYDGAHQLKVYYSVGRQSPVSAVNNLHIKVGEGRYDGTIHGPAYSIGVRTGISNLYSTIIGRELASGSNDQLCIGRYNDAENIGDCAFVVGNGTSSEAVSNALTVDWNGRIQCGNHAGTLTSIFDIFYPVGSYYDTSDSSFDPSTSWGGTWSSEEIVDDEIVEQGTDSTIWTYRKWKSGIAECWGRRDITISLNNNYGGAYYGTDGVGFPTGLFSAEPTVSVSRQGRQGTGLVHVSPYSVSSTQMQYFITNTNARYDSAPIGIAINARGLWKTYSAPSKKYRWHRTA